MEGQVVAVGEVVQWTDAERLARMVVFAFVVRRYHGAVVPCVVGHLHEGALKA